MLDNLNQLLCLHFHSTLLKLSQKFNKCPSLTVQSHQISQGILSICFSNTPCQLFDIFVHTNLVLTYGTCCAENLLVLKTVVLAFLSKMIWTLYLEWTLNSLPDFIKVGFVFLRHSDHLFAAWTVIGTVLRAEDLFKASEAYLITTR